MGDMESHHDEVLCDEVEVHHFETSLKSTILNPKLSKGCTWTLPRSGRRINDGNRSLPRPRSKLWKTITGETRGKESREKNGDCRLLFNGQTLPRPRSGHLMKRDEAPGGNPLNTCLSTCHSTLDMAGAATGPPDAATADSTSCAITNNIGTSITTQINLIDTNGTSFVNDDHFENSLSEKNSHDENQKESKIKDSDIDLELMGNGATVTSINSDDHTDSEESADSLYYTASDHTNSDAYSEIRSHDSEESSETAVYESVETPKTLRKVKNQFSQKNNSSIAVSTMHHTNVEQTMTSSVANMFETNTGGNIKSKSSSKGSDTTDDVESIGSESQYENISDSDHHRDSGYESPVKADIHSSDDAASTASSSSSVENHYEDIDPSSMGREGHPRESSRRSRSTKDTSSSSKVLPSSSRQEEDDDGDHDDDADSVEDRQRQRLQELDDLIAGVPPPDYDIRRPLHDGSAPPDVRSSGQHQGNIPPPPEFGDTSSGSGDSRSGGEPLCGHPQLHSTHSVPPHTTSSSTANGYLHQRSPLLRTSSEPTPPPPPPMPSGTPSPRSSPAIVHRNSHHHHHQSRDISSSSSHDSSQRVLDSRDVNSDSLTEDAIVKPSEFIRRNSQRGENGSFRGHKKVDRPMSLPLDVAEHYGKIMSNGKDRPPTTTQDDSSHATLPAKPHLTNGKSLPFIPPKFPSQPSGSGLIKPSEYLRSLGSSTARSPSGGDVKSLVALHSSESLSSSFEDQLINGDSQPASMPPGPLPAIPESTEEEPLRNGAGAPPPPPAPPAPPASSYSSSNTLNRSNTLSSNNTSSKSMLPTISVTDLQSVQLRKTETKVSRTTSVPLRVPLSPEPALTLAKNDVIAELKMSVDIPGIKKLKSERAKEELKIGKLEKDEINKQFTAGNFVDQIPETDNAGNRIPEWKRQMLARKAAERAKKSAEETRQQQMEEKRLQAIPPWKRQLMMRKEEDGKRSSLYIPKVEDVKKIHLVNSPQDISRIIQTDDKEEDQVLELQGATDNNSSHQSREPSQHNGSVEEEKEEPQMPWRTNLRKTNSKLSLLE